MRRCVAAWPAPRPLPAHTWLLGPGPRESLGSSAFKVPGGALPAGVVPEGSTEKAGQGPSRSELLSPPHCGEHCAKSPGRDLGLILGFVCQLRGPLEIRVTFGGFMLAKPCVPILQLEKRRLPTIILAHQQSRKLHSMALLPRGVGLCTGHDTDIRTNVPDCSRTAPLCSPRRNRHSLSLQTRTLRPRA